VRAALVTEAREYRWSSAGWATGGSPADQGVRPTTGRRPEVPGMATVGATRNVEALLSIAAIPFASFAVSSRVSTTTSIAVCNRARGCYARIAFADRNASRPALS